MLIKIIFAAIFAAPTLQVIGYLLLICAVIGILWWMLTKMFPPPASFTPFFPKGIAYTVFAFLVVVMVVWWCSFTFGLGIF